MKALIHSDAARLSSREHEKAISLSTYGIFFLGTPHQGGEGADIGSILARIGSLVTFTSHDVLRNLKYNSEWLQQQQGQYSDIANRFDTKFFYEVLPMQIPGYGQVLVCCVNASSLAMQADVLQGCPKAFCCYSGR